MRKLVVLTCLLVFASYLSLPDTEGNKPVLWQNDVYSEGETVIFFIPEDPDTNVSAYIYDSERNHLLVCSDGNDVIPPGIPKNSNKEEWIVLPGNIRAYTSPSLNSKSSDVFLSYPQKIESCSKNLTDSDNIEWIAFHHNGMIFYLPAPLLAKRSISRIPADGNLPIGSESVDRHTALPQDYKPNDPVLVSQRWNYHNANYPKYLRSEAARAIEEMLSTAQKEGIHIRIFSAYRSYEKQRYLYLREIDKNGLKQILVAKPGHSEHQLGTAVDLCGLTSVSVANADFSHFPEGKWLEKNSQYYGFVNSYREDNMEKHGYAYEPWHYRYMGVTKKEPK